MSDEGFYVSAGCCCFVSQGHISDHEMPSVPGAGLLSVISSHLSKHIYDIVLLGRIADVSYGVEAHLEHAFALFVSYPHTVAKPPNLEETPLSERLLC